MDANSHIAPYFAKSITPVFGLNHLGLRNAAEDLFTTLLPGLNGVTQRIRYYSFYCWITGEFLKLYHTEEERTDDAYRLFIRKSEILLALIQAERDRHISGIPGITFALSELAKDTDTFDLLRFVYRPEFERKTKETYWANPGGILRQYYSASLKDIALLFPLQKFTDISLPTQKSDDLPEETILGEDLGAAFRESIGDEMASLFLSYVQRSSVPRNELDKMTNAFIMKGFGNIGKEREMLIDLLNQKDFPANENDDRFLRKDTIRHFLLYCMNERKSGQRDSEQFPTVLYRKVLAGELTDDCSLGWYAYHINDRWQFHSSEVFFCLLKLLEDRAGWVSIEDISDQLSSGMSNTISSKEGATLGDVVGLIDAGELDIIDVKSPPEQAAQAMVSLLRLFCENRRHPEIIKAYQEAFRGVRRNDFFVFMDELEKQLDMPFMEFLKDYIIRKIIYRHHTVSLLKYSATHVTSNKFLLEDGYLKFLEQTEYTATAPRIDSLIEYLTDLELLKNMAPTPDAIQRYELA